MSSPYEPIIRFAKPQDLPQIVEIYNQSIPNKQATADLQPVTVADRQAWFDAHNPDKRPLVVAENAHGDMLGWASLSDLYARPAYHISSEISVYVDKAAKGQGVGRVLTNYLLELAPSCGVRQVVALIFGHNQPSLTMFGKLGFEQWGKYPQVCDMDGFIADVMILGRAV